jgi:hypothetical protein
MCPTRKIYNKAILVELQRRGSGSASYDLKQYLVAPTEAVLFLFRRFISNWKTFADDFYLTHFVFDVLFTFCDPRDNFGVI